MTEAAFGPGAGTPYPDSGPRTAGRLEAGTLVHAEAHRARLRAGAALLGPVPDWLDAAFAEACAWGLALDPGPGVLRMVVGPSALHARREPMPPLGPVRMRVMAHPLGDLRGDPRAAHKGLLGPWGLAVLAEARAAGADDALLLWPDGTVAESALATVGLELGGRFLLPPWPGRLAGLTERLDLPAWAAARSLAVVPEPFGLTEAASGRLWCFNAVRGFRPVESFSGGPADREG